MTAAIIFEFPQGWLFGLPLAAALAFAVWRQHRRGLAGSRIAALAALRGAGFAGPGVPGRAAGLDDPGAAGVGDALR